VKIAVAARDGGRCRICGSTVGLHYDHIVPYSRGGRSDDVNNIQLLCAKHNLRKGNRYVG
jgi:5-methylcytosine-specific restriction endonuclease McrA